MESSDSSLRDSQDASQKNSLCIVDVPREENENGKHILKNNGINLPKSEKENGKSIGYQMRQIQTGPHQNTLESKCQKLKAKRQGRKKQEKANCYKERILP